MNVQQLIRQLVQFPPDLEVYTSRDSEGNGFNSIYSVQRERMDDNNDVYAPEDYEDHYEDLRDVVVIWA